MAASPLGYKVLVLTSIYPADDVPKEWTPIVHYFTREWVKNGNEVRVVNVVSRFPNFAYWIARLLKERISSKAGFVIGDKPLPQRTYELEGVNVFRVPLRKTKPHGSFSSKDIQKAVKRQSSTIRQSISIPRTPRDTRNGLWYIVRSARSRLLRSCRT